MCRAIFGLLFVINIYAQCDTIPIWIIQKFPGTESYYWQGMWHYEGSIRISTDTVCSIYEVEGGVLVFYCNDSCVIIGEKFYNEEEYSIHKEKE